MRVPGGCYSHCHSAQAREGMSCPGRARNSICSYSRTQVPHLGPWGQRGWQGSALGPQRQKLGLAEGPGMPTSSCPSALKTRSVQSTTLSLCPGPGPSAGSSARNLLFDSASWRARASSLASPPASGKDLASGAVGQALELSHKGPSRLATGLLCSLQRGPLDSWGGSPHLPCPHHPHPHPDWWL